MRTNTVHRLTGRRSGGVRLAALGAPAPPAPSFQSDAGVSNVQAEGWKATYPSPPSEFDPAGDPKYLAVRRAGFSGVATASTADDELVPIMKRVRQVYPNDASLTASDAALAKHVYSGDQLWSSAGVLGGLTNNSTVAAPKPVACWLNHDRDVCDDATYTVRMVVAHMHARNGKPVAGVRFTADDGTTTLTVDVTSQTDHAFANGQHASVYEASFDFSSLDDGEVTINAVIYPWVGAAFDVSTDGSTYPSSNLTTLIIINNYGGAIAYQYAYVDPVGGSDPGLVHADPAVAKANPFATMQTAAGWLKGSSGTDDHNRAVMRLMAGTHDAGYTQQPDGIRPLLIERDPDAAIGAVILTQTDTTGLFSKRCKIKEVTYNHGSAAFGLRNNSSGGDKADLMILEGVVFGSGYDAAELSSCGRVYMIDCSGNDIGAGSWSSTRVSQIIAWGCSGAVLSGNNSPVYSLIGHAGQSMGDAAAFHDGANANMEAKRGQVFAFNHLSKGGSPGSPLLRLGWNAAPGARGFAVVGNVLEHYGSNSQAVFQVSSDGVNQAVENGVVQMNTFVGERCNFCYMEGAAAKHMSLRGNVFGQTWNSKGDNFSGGEQSEDGTFPVRHWVDSDFNVLREGSVNLDVYGSTGQHWLGEVAPLNQVTGSAGAPVDCGFADDQSNSGGDAGGGDYTPSGSALDDAKLPFADVPFAFDQTGAALGADAWPGAIQGA